MKHLVQGLCIVGALTLGPIGQATSRSDDQSDVVKVNWIHRPTGQQVGIAFNRYPPCHGDRLFTPGSAELVCRLSAEGRIGRCVVASEVPKDCAYGKIALSVASDFRSGRRTIDGRRIVEGMKVRLPFKFNAAKE